MKFFLSFKSFKSRKKVMESFFSGYASLSFHKIHNFLEQYFLRQLPLNFFDNNNILISMKKDAEHISVNTVGATFLLLAVVSIFPSYSCSKYFWKYGWKSPYVSNDCLWKLYL